MRIFKTRYFHRLARHEKLSDVQLKKAVEEIEQGLNDGDLGSFVFKKRIAIGGQGKRGGFRTIVAYKKGNMTIFMYGYPKNELENITPKEKEGFRQLSKYYFGMGDFSLKRLLTNNELIEVL